MGALESTESTTTRKPAGHLAPASFMWSHIARLAPQGLPRIPRALRGVYRSSLALKLGRLGGKMAFVAGAGIAAVGALGMTNGAQAEKKWPIMTRAEISKHKSKEAGVWVTYKEGVYDITEFVAQHPGGESRIMLAAGGAIDPFWSLYQQHLVENVLEILKQYRIGTLSAEEAAETADSSDPYSTDPKRHPALIVHKEKPFNAGTPPQLIPDNFTTPQELWYKRHHHPVPVVDPQTFRLKVEADSGVKGIRELDLSLDTLRKFPKHTVTTTLQCAGNRRAELNALGEKTQGLCWTTGAVSTATWGGVRLRDVLKAAGMDFESPSAKHIWFIGLDPPYDASIPIKKAIDKYGDVLLAYEMNGKDLPRDHGYPVRAIVPGHVAARQVKWVHKVVASQEESHSGWQRGVQYKGFSANIKSFKGVDPSKVASVQELPVQSAICDPPTNSTVSLDEGEVKVRGWAWSGGGRGIVRVDVTADEGKSWTTANLRKLKQEEGREWAWTLWEADLPIPAKDSFQICARAVDTSYNSQPGDVGPLWNLRGILNNSWHKITVKVDKD
ncbi:hypothetical protein AAMO2058_001289000 [Amorphochlora amoebiformis]